MGLRSPQELEQVRKPVQQVGRVEAGKTATIDLAEPAANFLQQKALNDQIASVRESVKLKKDSLSNITSKYAVESASAEIKANIASLKGDNAVAQSAKLFEQVGRELDELEDKAPEGLKELVRSHKNGKMTELRGLVNNKIYVEGQKAAVQKGETISKIYTMEAASSYPDIDKFKKEYGNVYNNAVDTGRMKGQDKLVAELEASFTASNSVFEGVKFSLTQAATPDKVDELKAYYDNHVAKDEDIYINQVDQGKINDAFTTAKNKAEEDMGLYLAEKAKGMSPTVAERYIKENAKGSSKAAKSGISLYYEKERAVKTEIEQRDRGIYAKAVKESRAGRPEAAQRIIQGMSPDGELKARTYLNNTDGGVARAYTDPKDFEALSKILRDDPSKLMEVDLDGYQLNSKDYRAFELAKNREAKSEQDKNFKIDSGSLENKALAAGERIAAAKMGMGAVTNPKTKNAINDRTRLITYQVRAEAENKKITNEAVIQGLINQRLETDLIQEVFEPNIIGDMLQNFGYRGESSWTGRRKNRVRGSEEFTRTTQTGLGAKPSPITKQLVPEPNKDEVASWKNQRYKLTGEKLDDATAKQEIIKLKESRLQGK